MDWAKPKAAMARLALLDSAAAEVAFFLALSLVPFVGIAIALVGGWLPVGLSASIGKVLRGLLPAESPVAAEVLSWARSSASKGWLTVGFLLAFWSSFRFMSLCLHALGFCDAAGPPRPRHFVRCNLPDLPRGRWHRGRLVPGGAGRPTGLTGLDRRQPGVFPRRLRSVGRLCGAPRGSTARSAVWCFS